MCGCKQAIAGRSFVGRLFFIRLKLLSATVRIKDVYTSFASIADVVLKNVAETLFLSYIDMSGVIIVRRKQIMELIGNLKRK